MKIFHHDDHDGYLSKFWVEVALHNKHKFVEIGKIVDDSYGTKFYEMNYDENTDFPFDEIQKDEQVVVLDYNIKPEHYNKFLKITKNILFIDHHKTTLNALIDYCKQSNLKMPKGVYVEGVSGSALTYFWFFTNLDYTNVNMLKDHIHYLFLKIT